MTTLYRPVKMTTVKQAEALIVGTIAYRTKDDETGQLVATLRFDDEEYAYYWAIAGEFEQIRETGGRRRTKTLYVTPWEEA